MKMEKTILNIQRLAEQFLEDEILKYEVYLLGIKERRYEESEAIQDLRGYLMYLYDEFSDGRYSEIQGFIDQYTNHGEIDQDTAYCKMLKKYFAKARIDSLNAMIDLYFGKTYKYTINKIDLNATIYNVGKNNKLKKRLQLKEWNSDRTKARQKNVNEIIRVVKDEFSNTNKKYNKDQIAWEIENRMSDKTSYNNIRKNYMIGWKEI